MKFYIAEKNIGNDIQKSDVQKVIDFLVKKGWDVAYGIRENELTSDDEKERQSEIEDAFADDFMNCLDELEI
jgi:muramidase (phage lysozyme)